MGKECGDYMWQLQGCSCSGLKLFPAGLDILTKKNSVETFTWSWNPRTPGHMAELQGCPSPSFPLNRWQHGVNLESATGDNRSSLRLPRDGRGSLSEAARPGGSGSASSRWVEGHRPKQNAMKTMRQRKTGRFYVISDNAAKRVSPFVSGGSEGENWGG